MTETPVCAPPVILDNYYDFKKFASRAALLTYNPEYLRSPFTNDKKRLCRVTLFALGVFIHRIPFTFKYVLEYPELLEMTNGLIEGEQISDEILLQLLENLTDTAQIIRGNVESSQPVGELLSARL